MEVFAGTCERFTDWGAEKQNNNIKNNKRKEKQSSLESSGARGDVLKGWCSSAASKKKTKEKKDKHPMTVSRGLGVPSLRACPLPLIRQSLTNTKTTKAIMGPGWQGVDLRVYTQMELEWL